MRSGDGDLRLFNQSVKPVRNGSTKGCSKLLLTSVALKPNRPLSNRHVAALERSGRNEDLSGVAIRCGQDRPDGYGKTDGQDVKRGVIHNTPIVVYHFVKI
jgi:hypothetical protein